MSTEPYHKQLTRIAEAARPTSAVEGQVPETAADTQTKLREILAALRALAWLHQTLHWQVSGENAYGLHLLFERLYGGIGQEIDTLAEKMVSYFGPEIVERNDAMTRAMRWLRRWDEKKPVAAATEAEKQLQGLLRQSYDAIKEKKDLTLGLDDFLMTLADNHETALYLLGRQS